MIPLLLICLLSSALANDEEYVTVKIGNKRTLNCKTKEPVTWTFSKNSTESGDEAEIVAEENLYKIDGSKLVLLNVQEEHLGFYQCSSKDDTLIRFELDISFKLKRMPLSVSIDEGSSTELKCSLHSSGLEVVFKWFSKPEFESEEGSERTLICSKPDCSTDIVAEALFDKRDKDAPVTPLAERSEITTGEEEDIPYSIFKINNAFLEDRKIYICQAILKDSEEDIDEDDCKESKECDEVETILRVKDPLAAVWPFVGIVVEVVLLCVIIFFCERRKSEEKDDYDEGTNEERNQAILHKLGRAN
eukprot:GFUD01097943.1.p1 GENE.GFUD01097943.1~~GFUD01097943.1.p1  ORF type:complete len:304 (+),score=80.61 GFUD01097943.1:49-960(+)